jgi:hypothetical protein
MNGNVQRVLGIPFSASGASSLLESATGLGEALGDALGKALPGSTADGLEGEPPL